ncbi:MAG: M20/M25/M40 family metallo-hydrolase [Caldilineaceae bacterium]|nr:M20/M25/M40 family metallo-hydrolase [Caldilineaceae bacterium]
MVQREQLAHWLSRLVQLPSVSPDQAGPRAGVAGETRIAEEVATWFRRLGGEVQVDPVLPGRPNVYGIWRGTTDQWFGVDVHMDTAGVEQMTGDPFSGAITDTRVYGRGAVDDKASLAVVLALLEQMQAKGRRPAANLLIAATVDEEVGALGAPAAARWLQRQGLMLEQLIVAEPTLCTPVYGHKGVVRLAFPVLGQAAHSSQPHLGHNAIVAAAQLVLALQAEHERLLQLPPTGLGNPTLTVSLINGGTGINVVPNLCTVSLDRRVVNGERTVTITEALQQLAERSCPQPLTMQVLQLIEAYYQDPAIPFVQNLAAWSGTTPQVAPYGTNAWAYTAVSQACVVFGPGAIEQAHGPEEWVALAELEKAAQIYAQWWGLGE